VLLKALFNITKGTAGIDRYKIRVSNIYYHRMDVIDVIVLVKIGRTW
jgi:hypothetical protein